MADSGRPDGLVLREATNADFAQIWPIFHAVVATGDTYAYAADTSREEAYEAWMAAPERTCVAEVDGTILGTYTLKPNHPGPGSHVCNCGYMVTEAARGQGLATAMCEHSQRLARELGYVAMQFNLVVASNSGAVRLWQKLGFDIVGTLPEAFLHRTLGYVDAYVMYKKLVPAHDPSLHSG